MRCCWRNSVRRVDSVGMRREHRLDAERAEQFEHLLERSRGRASASRHSSSPPGCGVLLSFRYWRRRRTRCTFSAMLTIWNQAENARISLAPARLAECALRTHHELDGRIRIALATADGGLAVAFDLGEKASPALVAADFAHEIAERMHVVAKCGVLEREEDVFACHAALYAALRRSAKPRCSSCSDSRTAAILADLRGAGRDLM